LWFGSPTDGNASAGGVQSAQVPSEVHGRPLVGLRAHQALGAAR
jgi:hypothetical protein